MSSQQCLRCITYLCPDLPVEYFELILHYLEEKLEVYSELLYESRWSGPTTDRPNPFVVGHVDIGFMDSFSYLNLLRAKDIDVELLPVSSVHFHNKGEDRPGHFADVISHIDHKERTKEFLDLRGSKWAYSRPRSISGNLVTLQALKELGENPSFFGNTLVSGSHTKSIEMVLRKSADAASVDANVLTNYLAKNPSAVDQLFVVTSWGMLSPYPIVVNSKLDHTLKQKITSALLKMHTDPKFSSKLKAFNVRKFAESSHALYNGDVNVMEITKSLNIGSSIYY